MSVLSAEKYGKETARTDSIAMSVLHCLLIVNSDLLFTTEEIKMDFFL